MADCDHTGLTKAQAVLEWLGGRGSMLAALCGGFIGVPLAALMDVSVVAYHALTPNELWIVLPTTGAVLAWLTALAWHLDQ